MTQSSTETAPQRLTYELSLGGRGMGGTIAAFLPSGQRVEEGNAKRLLTSIHALDVPIMRELVGGPTYGQLTDTQIARVLPLLALRQTKLANSQLKIDGEPLYPRIRVESAGVGGLRLMMGLVSKKGEWRDLQVGRLFCGSQAYFVDGPRIHTVESAAPWELANWARMPVLDLGADLGAKRRDEIVRQLTKIGIPPADLAQLSVQRNPPDRYVINLSSPGGTPEPEARIVLEADYGGERVVVLGREPTTPYIVPQNASLGLIERDLGSEHAAKAQLLAAGFRFDGTLQAFVAHGEVALAALDPKGNILPKGWHVDRGLGTPAFRTELRLDTKVKLENDSGMLELNFNVEALDDTAAVQALVEMKDLLSWLETGQKYVRLADGSYAAPSAKLKKALRAISDLGADGARALVSPMCIGLLRAIGEDSAVAAADAATAAWLGEVSGKEHPAETTLPKDLSVELRDYQHRGLDWMMMLHRHRLTGILADDMGLGKTLQTLTLLLKVRELEGPKPSLVIAPTSVLSVWRDEAARFAPTMSVGVWHGDPEERKQLKPEQLDLIVTSYGVLRRDTEQLSKVNFRYVILDEAQSAKNASTQNAKSVRKLKSERRLALSGTPIENRPDELWAAFDFLAPGFLGSVRHFRKRYGAPIDRGDSDALSLLRARVQPFVLRRLKDDVAKELPPKLESVVRCDMTGAQRVLYDHVAGQLRTSVQEKIEKVGIERAHLDILAALTRLRQICCDPSLLPAPEGTKIPPSAKLGLFTELMREALGSSRRILVFSQFVEMQKRLIEVVRELGVEPLWLHGGTKKRDEVVAKFQDPSGPPVIIVSLKAGGTGLTLTRADTVMHYDPWWNPAVERQATDRAHRLGQKHQVTVYKLVCTNSIEERVLEMASRKEAVAAQLLTNEGEGPKRITANEIMKLFE